MSNGNERNDSGEVTTTNFAETARIPQQHRNFPLQAAQPPQVAITNWVNSCGRADEMCIEDIIDACWMLEPVVTYINYRAVPFAFRHQLVKMWIRQALISYIDTAVIASVPSA